MVMDRTGDAPGRRPRLMLAVVAVACAGSALSHGASAQGTTPPAAQNPSPMAESRRAHGRLEQRPPVGTIRTFAGPAGRPVEILIPPQIQRRDSVELVIHFHGAAWVPQQAVAAAGVGHVVAVVNVGAGSGAYDRAFADPSVLDSLMANAAQAVAGVAGRSVPFSGLTLAGFSAGHGAIRAILRVPRHFALVDAVLLLDGMHTSYLPEGSLLATGGALDTTNLSAFAAFARAAVRGEKTFLVTHSEIFPGTFASTTETADWLLNVIGVRPAAVLQWGPRGMQQLSEAHAGRFRLLGFAGNTAPDHIDHFHAMPELFAMLRSR